MRSTMGLGAVMLCMLTGQAFANSIICESVNNAFIRCDLPEANALNVQLLKVKAGNCQQTEAWGADSQGIWVDKGCGGVFVYNAPSPSTQSSDENSDDADVLTEPVLIDDPGLYTYSADGDYYYNNYNGDCNADHDACNHYKKGYQAGQNDARENLGDDYTRHQGQFNSTYAPHYSRGYAGGFHGGGGRR